MDLQNKVAIVTGGNSGLGRAISKVLAAEGAEVALLARDEEKLNAVRDEIEAEGGSAIPVSADLTEPQAVEGAINGIAEQCGRIDVVVNNAGLGIFKTVEEMDLEEWDLQLDVMLRGAFLVTKHAFPHIYEQERGHLVMISSLWARRFCAKCSGYTAAKFGVRGLAQSLREDARPHNVKVTNVMPGTVDTPFFHKTDWETDLSHALQPEDVASTVLHALQLPDRAAIEEVVLQAIMPDQCTC